MAATTNSDDIEVWSVSDWKGRTLTSGSSTIKQRDGTQIAFSPDGKFLASTVGAGHVRTWHWPDGKMVTETKEDSSAIRALDYAAAGRFLMVSRDDGRIQFLDASTLEVRATLLALRDSSDWLVVTPDGLFDGTRRHGEVFCGDSATILLM